MEWTDYIKAVGNRQIFVDGLLDGAKLSVREIEALLLVLPNRKEQLSFAQALTTPNVFLAKSTLTTQFQNIYLKFGIKNKEQLVDLLRSEFDKIHNQESQTEKVIQEITTVHSQQKKQLFGATQIRRVHEWVGRDELLIELYNDLINGRKVLLLYGQGGIGKTSLAVKLLEACGVDPSSTLLPTICPYDNVLYCEINETDSFDRLTNRFLSPFGLTTNRSGATSDQIIEMIVERLHQEQWLVVIDNLESLLMKGSNKSKSPEIGLFLNRLTYGGHNSQIIITSRKSPDDLNDPRGKSYDRSIIKAKQILGISNSDSIQLLKNLGMQDSDDDLQWIVDQVKGNVLILKLLANYADRPGQLRKEPSLVTDEAMPIVKAQWERQDEVSQELLRRMCVLRIEMDASALTILRLLQTNDEEIKLTYETQKVTAVSLIELVNCGLVEESYNRIACKNLYVLHKLISETLQAMVKTELQDLWLFAARLYDFFEQPKDYHCLDDLQFDLEKLHFWWMLEMYEDVSKVVIESLLTHLGKWSYWNLQKEWCERVLLHTKGINYRICLQTLGTVYRNIGQWDKAQELYTKSLELCIEMDDYSGMANSWAFLGYITYKQGKWVEVHGGGKEEENLIG